MTDGTVERILGAIPPTLRDASGKALYTGLSSWTNPSPLYLMGINPGGDPAEEPDTVGESAAQVLLSENFSAYQDEGWANGKGGFYEPRKHPMQRSVLHVFGRLGLDPCTVPTSNMVYARSRRASDIATGDMNDWAEECWPFHQEMIKHLGIRIVLCMGVDTANFVRGKVGAHALTATFTEDNRRRFVSRLYTGGSVDVVQAAHPSRSYWFTKPCDITPLLEQALDSSGLSFA